MTDDDIPDGVFDDVETLSIGDVNDYQNGASALVSTHDDEVMQAIQTAVWHTIIDDAGHEEFVDDLRTWHFRKAIQRLRDADFASEPLTKEDIYSSDSAPFGAAFFVGDGAADAIEELRDSMVRINKRDSEVEFGNLPSIDGYTIERSAAMPSNLIALIDVAALARRPVEGTELQFRSKSDVSVSSPIVVTEPDGIAIINLDA